MYTVYKIINDINDRYYIGVHKTQNPYDSYMGSGRAIKHAISKYGSDHFTKDILHVFDTKEEAYAKEVELLNEHLNNALCYNMNAGGHGGFDYINSNRDLYQNPMKDPVAKAKQTAAAVATKNLDKEKYRAINRINIKKAIEYNTGKKRPKQSTLMKKESYFVTGYWADKEKIRDKMSAEWTVVSPDGIVYNTNRLEDFCKEMQLTYVAVWNTHRTGKPVKKGRSKGWRCTKV